MSRYVARLPVSSLLSILSLIRFAAPAEGQLIPVKTVRLAQGDQFAIFPSVNLAKGGVSIAVTDSLLDPFINPAKGARVGASRFFGTPALYSVSSHAGGGRTLPVGTLMRAGPWFGGAALAVQQVDASRTPVNDVVFVAEPGPCPLQPGVACATASQTVLPAAEQTHGNELAFASLGRTVTGTGLSVGGSVLWARLTGVDGVDVLYARSVRVKQFGHTVDFRLGALQEWRGDRSLEALLLYDRFGMTHDVTYLDAFWDPGTQRVLQRTRIEENFDQTNTWGLHLTYQQPLGAHGWRIGWLATANSMAHPKIPNYEMVNAVPVPWDPGHTWAYNLGVGVSRREGSATFGLDAIYEPIRSTTWGEAAIPTETRLGDTIAVGGRTIENRFRFSNALVRLGIGDETDLDHSGTAAGLQLGLAVRSIGYHVEQQDNVQVSSRRDTEHWIEWTPTWGVSLRFPKLEVRYRGEVINGTGRPGVSGSCSFCDRPTASSGGILVAPSGPITLTPVRVFTHQVSVTLPLR